MKTGTVFCALMFFLGSAPFFVMQAYAVEKGDLIGGTSQNFGTTPGAIVLVSQTDGSQTFLGDPTTEGSLAGLAFDASGILWGANNIDVSPGSPITELIHIDPDTAMQVGSSIPLTFNGHPATVQDLAVQPGTDVLFASSSFRALDLTLPADRLVTIDKTTGEVTIVGSLPPLSIHSIGFDPNTGALYRMGSDSMLHNINPADATVNSKKLITGLGSFSARGLGVDDSGTIWVSNVITTVFQPIWTIAIDPVAGTVQATLIGNGTPDLLADLAFVRGSPDSDGDGVLDGDDLCPASDLDVSVVIEGCDTVVENLLFADGCSLADRVHEALAIGGEDALEDLLENLEDEGILIDDDDEAEAIEECAEDDSDDDDDSDD